MTRNPVMWGDGQFHDLDELLQSARTPGSTAPGVSPAASSPGATTPKGSSPPQAGAGR